MFPHDLPASKLAALSDVSRPTINQRFFKLRTRIAQLCDASSPFLAGGWIKRGEEQGIPTNTG